MVWEWRLADGRRTGRNLYGDEAIPPQPPAEKTPKLLRAMRALVKTHDELLAVPLRAFSQAGTSHGELRGRL